jgi:murein DD-endopeptidase MepM/ murein hydrolase activator NlpD
VRAALACLLATALLLAGTIVAASGQEPGRVGRALATIYTTFGDPQAEIFNDEPGTTKRETLSDFEADGVRIGDGVATAQVGEDASAVATVSVSDILLLNGDVVATGVRRTARMRSDGHVTYSGTVSGLEIDGQFYGDIDGSDSIPLRDGGRVFLNRGNTALQVVVDDENTPQDASVGVVRTSQKDAPATTVTPTPTPRPTSTPTATPSATPDPADKAADRAKAKAKADRATRKRLVTGGWTFPVYGNARVADNFGAVRAAPIVEHQGVDIFAPFGSPVVAVRAGTLRHVGTLPISGNRLWLETDAGDWFFYAHLSAFAPDAEEGAEVEAGTVLGYAGNTGDAEPTPPHVHFEIHPGGEKKEPVDPYPIVIRWQADAGSRQRAESSERPGSLVTVRDFLAE